ncbi:MAG TPA: hypothetical protein VMD29_06395 [Terracidiphilus sp.]|nr:hypothetical protein [Terracidiphilus sp.]
MRKWRIALWIVLLVAAGVIGWKRFGHGHGAGLPGTAVPDLSVSSPLNQPGGAPEPDEAYAIYSALYRDPANEPLALAGYTSTDIPQLDGSCLKPQNAEEQALTDAFVAANKQSHPWQQKFAIGQGYRLLNAREVNEALECLEAKAGALPECAAYKDLRHVRFLGAPGFNPDHSRALVSIIRKCGRYCGSGGVFEVEKTGGTWKRADVGAFTEQCSWMFQR